jgi:hypothetical protein
MDVNPLQVLQVLFGIILVFFLPGYLMVKALFPGRNELDKEYNVIYEIGLGMGLSIVIVILDGFFLGSLHQLVGFRDVGGVEKGWFDAPYIWASLLLICLLLFIAGWYRGAFPWMGRLHPRLARVPASEKPEARKKRMDGLILKLWDLSREREKLRKEVRDSERRSRARGKEMNQYYKKKLAESRERLSKVDEEMKKLEEERALELAGVEEDRLHKRIEKERRRAARKPLFGKKDKAGEETRPEEKPDEPKPDESKSEEKPGESGSEESKPEEPKTDKESTDESKSEGKPDASKPEDSSSEKKSKESPSEESRSEKEQTEKTGATDNPDKESDTSATDAPDKKEA